MRVIIGLILQKERFLSIFGILTIFLASVTTLVQAIIAANLLNSSLISGRLGEGVVSFDGRETGGLGEQLSYIFSLFIERGNEVATRYVIEQNSIPLLLVLISVVLLVLIFSQLIIFGKNIIISLFTIRISVRLRENIFNRLLYLPGRYFRHQESGSILYRLTEDAAKVESSFALLIENALFGPILSCLGLGLLFYLDYRLTMVILANVVIIIGLTGYISTYIRQLAIKIAERGSNINSHVFRIFSMIDSVKIFCRERWESLQYKVFLRKYMRHHFFLHFIEQLIRPLNEIIGLVGVVSVIFYGTVLIWQKQLRSDELFTFLFVLLYVVPYFQRMASVSVTYKDLQVSVERILDIMQSIPEQEDFGFGSKVLTNFKGHIEFQNVFFSYTTEKEKAIWAEQRGLAERTTPQKTVRVKGATANAHVEKARLEQTSGKTGGVLQKLSFTVTAGAAIGIVGESGSGKSTIANLLSHFIVPERGLILLDGHTHRDFTIASIRRHIAMVTQETFCFDGTIFDNIRYGRLSASREEVLAVAKLAYLHDFILSLEGGYDTEIGERGVRLSGGQKQRLAIARTILKRSRVLILDEATSALDAQSEWEVQKAIDSIIGKQTTFIIAHRFSTLRKVQLILVLSAGHIAEMGTNDELLAQNGIYARLYKKQFLDQGKEDIHPQ